MSREAFRRVWSACPAVRVFLDVQFDLDAGQYLTPYFASRIDVYIDQLDVFDCQSGLFVESFNSFKDLLRK